MIAPKIGLLPLYVKLYDEVAPELCDTMTPFLKSVVDAFQRVGVAVVEAPVCRLREDVSKSVEEFEQAGVDMIVTLHLAYSPSLESAEVLSGCDLPILMLDSTPDKDFGPDVDPQRLIYNHGIHGLQDLACMLRRHKKKYQVVAGHLSDPQTMARAEAVVRGAQAASKLRSMRVLRIGSPFEGMGDFQVPDEELHEVLGIHVDQVSPEVLLDDVECVTEEDVAREMTEDKAVFLVEVDAEVHQRSVRLGLGLRRYLEQGDYQAFSMNFLAFDIEQGPLSTVPFLECSKAMERGMGYAGEGDVLTAALVGAMNSAVGPTTFAEMFCPDWSGGTVFLSHMGEFNHALAVDRPLLYEKDFPFTPTQNPAALACAPRPGPASLVNLAPGPGGTFDLLVAPVEILGDGTHPDYKDWIRGWIRPAMPLVEFLEAYSYHGGTHHCALVLGDCREALLSLARVAGLTAHVIPEEGTTCPATSNKER